MAFMVMSACLFSLGTYLAGIQQTRSTYICFDSVDSRPRTLFFQLVGLALDAVVIILLSRIMAWTRYTGPKLRVLGSMLALSALCTTVFWLMSWAIFGVSRRTRVAPGSLYAFDVLVDGVVFAVFIVSASLWACETSMVTASSVMTFLVGIYSSSMHLFALGDWMHSSRAATIVPIWLVVLGTLSFTYTHDLQSTLPIRRALWAIFLVVLVVAATIVTFTRRLATFDNRHPINDLIYGARTSHSRWLTKASTSNSLLVAAQVYEERHSGRAPPPNFAEWYGLASTSVIVDAFSQIDADLAPFWGVSPAELRKRAEAMAGQVGIATITIKNGEVTGGDAGSDGDNLDLDEVVEMINKFSKHLPDMVLPINVSPTPRVLPPWSAVWPRASAGLSSVVGRLSTRSAEELNQTAGMVETGEAQGPSSDGVLPSSPVGDFGRMQVEACPPGSRIRRSPHRNVAQFCGECVKGHSRGQFLVDLDRSLEVCAQPDLMHLHAFVMMRPMPPPIRQLVPLFGASKTDGFKDVLIPIPRSRLDTADSTWQFTRRYDSLIWRASAGNDMVSDQALRGSHKFRLAHLVQKPSRRDGVAMVLPTPGKTDGFRTEWVSGTEASSAVPFSVGINDYAGCVGDNCGLAEGAFGSEAKTEEPLEYRYVLLTDEDGGPAKGTLRTIRSGSVPLISTVFRTWYTERLQPWLHFVPIDVRYHALHTTVSYFTGTEKRPEMNGRDTALKGRTDDAEWIGQQGQRWAEKALAKKDMEIYLFRVLLEWGRLIDDERGKIGYREGQDGTRENVGWTRTRL